MFNSDIQFCGFFMSVFYLIVNYGNCDTECDFDRVGPECQYENIAYRKGSRHDSNIISNHYAYLANDNKLATCSYTSDKNTVPPWWNLWIPEYTTFKKFEFVTIESYRDHFPNFEVTVYNTTEENFKRKGNVSGGIVCYKNDNSNLRSTKVEITCTGSPVGNLIRVQLYDAQYQLVICDFRLYGGCANGFYGNTCEKCSKNCRSSQHLYCNSINGYCTHGCIAGWKGEKCETACERYQWGENCGQKCGHCDGYTCDRTSGVCQNGCAAGYKLPSCTEVCGIEYHGKNCTQKCSVNCVKQNGKYTCNNVDGTCSNGCYPGYKGPLCDIDCENGKWGLNCANDCGKCDKSICSKVDGNCQQGCVPGFLPPKCSDECSTGYYGKHCKSQCNRNCLTRENAICNSINGTCLNGCKDGYKGLQCDKECGYGKWGSNCQNNCGKCLSSPCNHKNGYCTGECVAGYKRTRKCDTECDDGKYGLNCASSCSKNCIDTCHKKTGKCSQCKAGWKGDNCTEQCDPYQWGDQCQRECGNCKNEEPCDRVNGRCSRGCLPGFKPTDLCYEQCEDGTYGDACQYNCSDNCEEICDKINGTCDHCLQGWTGDFCDKAILQDSLPSTGDSTTSGIVSALAVIFVLILIGVALFIFFKRNHQNEETKTESKISNNVIGEVNDDRANISRDGPDLSASYVNASEVQLKVRETKKVSNESGVENDYSVPKTAHGVILSQFEEYVKTGLANSEFFFKQFQQIPYGMQYASDVATKPKNHCKNRYKSMYAYDHSRVILRTLPDQPDTDYINASKIMGNSGKMSYIAAQGPISNTLGDFWRMIWEQNVRTIVMLTNLTEEGKMKCLKYWPNAGESVEHESVVILSELEDVFAEFTIRRFKLHQKNKPDRTRTLAHFHFTAWPDKDVPRSTSSLLHFWHQVRKHDEKKTRPWLVHCSAGVGRTGTFIGLDVLCDMGKDWGFVDVFKCVDDLRKQRVNMVQTKNQYKFLHCVVLEALVLPSEPDHIDNFHSVYNHLNSTDPMTRKTSLLMQYEHEQSIIKRINSSMTWYSSAEVHSSNMNKYQDIREQAKTLTNDNEVIKSFEDPNEDKYSVAKKDENKHKNRFDDILAPSDCRPFLLTQVPGCSDYINAVFVPGYRDKFAYILTQTPLQSTAVDCCRLIYEQEIKIVVTFQEYNKKDVGVYLPDGGVANIGPFTMKFIGEKDLINYTRRNFKLTFKSEAKEVTQVIFKHWSPSRMTPADPTKMLSFLENLETLRRQKDCKPILMQCLNGAERSGLVVVLMSILEQLKFNKEVSIPLVIRQLQCRRQQLIPNFEQFRFCYDLVLSHIESHTTYANM